ncbi:MAG: hypothetical protein D6E12_11205, partial [Desulfovibrio sp.]
LKRRLMRINSRMVQAPVNIPQNAIPCSVEELQHRIAEYARELAATSQSQGDKHEQDSPDAL